MHCVLEDVHVLHRSAGIVDYAVQVACALWVGAAAGHSVIKTLTVTTAASCAACSAAVNQVELLV